MVPQQAEVASIRPGRVVDDSFELAVPANIG